MPLFFAITLFVSSALLFLVQPMIAKMILPRLGGAPAVWNTCMVFFQAALLAGYAYAHGMPAWLGVRRHALFHLALLILPVTLPPLALYANWEPPGEANPIPWLFAYLAVCIGLPFFAISANAPLVQMWFAGTGHASAKDPYFLYSASNLGSMLALLSYPILLEPNFTLTSQRLFWTIGYGMMVVLMLACAVFLWRGPQAAKASASAKREGASTPANPHSILGVQHSLLTTYPILARLHWIALAFVPSSLMLSVTTYVTTDIAAIPLLWVIPLALYLLTFILVFARKPPLSHAVMARISPMVILVLTMVMLTQSTTPLWIIVPLHLLAFFVIALVCHGQLAASHPPVQYLTEFYLWLAVGGVLGGLFNALVAPLIFTGIVEYPLVLVFACLLRPALSSEMEQEIEKKPARKKMKKKAVQPAPQAVAKDRHPVTRLARPLTLDILLPILIGVLTGTLVWLVQKWLPEHNRYTVGIMFGIPAVLCYTFLNRPLRYGLGIAALLLAGSFYQGIYGATLHRERSFFGVHRISEDVDAQERKYHILVHGNTVHGRQCLDAERLCYPLTYYHHTGPIGQVFSLFSGPAAKKDVALIGLGTGSLAAYGEAGQRFTFYEIDPAVVRLARDSGYFTFLEDSPAHLDYVYGDARLTLAKATDMQFGMIVIDAFSSDSIPLHLITWEALQLYMERLADKGILAFHISNRYLDLQPVLGDLAHDAGLVCWASYDLASPEEQEEGKTHSIWVVMARHKADLGTLVDDRRWQRVSRRRGTPVWTDDFSNLLSVFIWHQEE